MLLLVVGLLWGCPVVDGDTLDKGASSKEALEKLEIGFKSVSDLEHFKNLTPETVDIRQENLFSAALSAPKNGINLDGLLLFDEGRHKTSEVSSYGRGRYSLNFMVRPTGAYWFGMMLGDRLSDERSFVYFKQRSAILCYAFFNGGGYKLVLSVDGNVLESKALGTWVWDKKWYRMVLDVKSATDVTAGVIDLSSNETADSISYSSPVPMTFLPAKLHLITETSSKMENFLRLSRFMVEVDGASSL